MAVSTVHQRPACHAAAPAAPRVHNASPLGEKTASMPRGRSAAVGSSTRLATYRTIQTTVTASTKFHRRKSVPSAPPNPHMPGLRRPQTRQTAASAFVKRPHAGHRMAPEVLRNIVTIFCLSEEADRAMRIAGPDKFRLARRTAEAMHVSASYSVRINHVNLLTFRTFGIRLPLTVSAA